MKVLSLTEPYATLIRKGIKTIETRSWKTSYRGKLYIHFTGPSRFRLHPPGVHRLGVHRVFTPF